MCNTSTGSIYICIAEAMNSQTAPPPAASVWAAQELPSSQALLQKPQEEDPTPKPEGQDTEKHADGITQYATALDSHFHCKSPPHHSAHFCNKYQKISICHY